MKRSLGAHTILYPNPALVVGTFGEDDRPNIATVAWAGICCSRPPCVAVSLRAATKTHGNIAARGAFTLNVPSERYAEAVDYAGTATGHEEAKFETTGLTPVPSDLVDAPYVGEFPVVLECRLLHTFELGLHTQYVGEILDVKADESVLGEEGLPDVEKIRPLIYSTSERAYYGVGARVADAFVRRDGAGR